MKNVEVGPIEVRHPSDHNLRIYIEGGWKAKVPEVEIDDHSLRAYARVLGSVEKAREIHQKLYESAYIESLRNAIARRAQQYARQWPQLVEPKRRNYYTSKRYCVLRGFDPERLQATFIPYDITGRAGNDVAREMLTEMGQGALAS